jgi:hypothetical protein
MKIVQVTFNLNNSNAKPEVKIYEVVRETTKRFYCKNEDGIKVSFFKSSLNAAICRSPLEFSYRFLTRISQVEDIFTSRSMMCAVTSLWHKLTMELNHYSQINNEIFSDYLKDY